MRKTARFAMRGKRITVTAAVLLLVAIALTACGGTSAPPTEQPAATEVAVATAMPTEEPTQAPKPTDLPTEPPPTDTPLPTDTPTPEPTDTPVPEPIDDSGCIACHTDEGILQELAKEPEEAESLSEGEG
jgi:septal ring-binding cell division protein DamX